MRRFNRVDAVKLVQFFIGHEDTGGLDEADLLGELTGIIHVGVSIHLHVKSGNSGIA